MTFNLRRIGVTAAAAALSLSIVACHGQSSGTPSYLPTGSSGISTQQQLDRGIAPAGEEHGEMFSSSGTTSASFWLESSPAGSTKSAIAMLTLR